MKDDYSHQEKRINIPGVVCFFWFLLFPARFSNALSSGSSSDSLSVQPLEGVDAFDLFKATPKDRHSKNNSNRRKYLMMIASEV